MFSPLSSSSSLFHCFPPCMATRQSMHRKIFLRSWPASQHHSAERFLLVLFIRLIHSFSFSSPFPFLSADQTNCRLHRNRASGSISALGDLPRTMPRGRMHAIKQPPSLAADANSPRIHRPSRGPVLFDKERGRVVSVTLSWCLSRCLGDGGTSLESFFVPFSSAFLPSARCNRLVFSASDNRKKTRMVKTRSDDQIDGQRSRGMHAGQASYTR